MRYSKIHTRTWRAEKEHRLVLRDTEEYTANLGGQRGITICSDWIHQNKEEHLESRGGTLVGQWTPTKYTAKKEGRGGAAAGQMRYSRLNSKAGMATEEHPLVR